jgi:hypothetical protein
VTTTKVDKMTREEKERLRVELERQVKEYTEAGGTVTQCPPRAFTPDEGPKRKFAGSQFDSLTDPTNRDVGAVRPTKREGKLNGS